MPKTRKDRLNQIAADGTYDVIVVGGGINGIGVFRELTLQDVRVLLVERSDFCSGCSAAPSRMIHGGLRYLENGEFSLVKESLGERDGLLLTAPHMVRPLPTTIPIVGIFSGLWNSAVSFFGGNGKPSCRGVVPIKIGLGTYDWLTRKRRVLPPHVFRGRRATHAQWRHLTPEVRCSATYYDAWISHPERLGYELIADASEISPASSALNYATLRRRADGGFHLVDEIERTCADVTANVLVNATGAWLDETRAALSGSDTVGTQLISGTKGSHLILHNPALLDALGGHMLFFENADGRICIAFPYLGRVLAGSTDIRVDKPSRVRCEDEERDYILASLRRLFPTIAIATTDIVFSFSGIRPLPRSTHAFTGRISRGHFTRRIDGTPPQVGMVGGKWTTFRAFAEQVADEVLDILGRPRRRDSRTLPIGGGLDFPRDRQDLVRRYRFEFNLDQARAVHLVDHYGTKGKMVQTHCAKHEDDTPLVPGCGYTAAEIDYLVRHEQVVRLGDLALRRTDLAITGQMTLAMVDALASIAATALGWSQERTTAERTAFLADLSDYHGVSLEPAGHATDRRKECV